jgi:hypothetical protein
MGQVMASGGSPMEMADSTSVIDSKRKAIKLKTAMAVIFPHIFWL